MVSIAEEIRGTGYRVQLDKFEGPLDLLLFLIKRDEIDIYDIPISHITDQYLEHVQIIQMLDLDVAGEFLVMAATLMRIKAKMLLPRPAEDEEEEEEDPREELVRRLLEYRRFKRAAESLTRSREERGMLVGRAGAAPEGVEEEEEEEKPEELLIPVDMVGLLRVFAQLIERAPRIEPYEVILDEYNMEEKAELIEHRLDEGEEVEFTSLFGEEAPKQEVIVTFVALLELLRLQKIRLVQSGLFGRIWIRRRAEEPDGIPNEPRNETGP